MIEIRLCPKTPDELRLTARFLDALSEAAGGGAAAGAMTGAGTPEADPGARADATAAPPAAVEDSLETAEGAAGEDGEIPFRPFDAPRPAPSPQEVLEALQGYARTAGAAALKDLLDRFGARRVSEIRPEHHAEVMATIRGEAAP